MRIHSHHALDMLSRLKGIETLIPVLAGVFGSAFFGYAFPFEGNWNSEHSAANTNAPNVRLWICFPVWRELKHFSAVAVTFTGRLWICFPVWRELKQIYRSSRSSRNIKLWICFPVWRELKPISKAMRSDGITSALDMLSRLKGIETPPVGSDLNLILI